MTETAPSGNKLEEMYETFDVAFDNIYDGGRIERACREGLRAVLRKHIEPLLAEAHADGVTQMALMAAGRKSAELSFVYASRVIQSLTGET